MRDDTAPETLTVHARNVGGIDKQEITFDAGVSILTGRNATNRTSLLQAISAALGGESGQLKANADEGHVELSINGEESFDRMFKKVDGSVRVSGEPYLEDGTLVDLFSSLVEANPARQAVERADGDTLRDIIMEPVDTADIRRQIEECQRNVRQISDRIEEIDRRQGMLPELKERKRQKMDELIGLESEIDDLRDTVSEYEADPDTAQEAESVVEELKDTRSTYESVCDTLETQKNARESLKEEREEIRDELKAVNVPEAELKETKRTLERLRRDKRELENTINNLISIVEFNEDLFDEKPTAIPETETETGTDTETSRTDSVVDELDPMSQTIECWTCGTQVEKREIEGRLQSLRAVIEEKRNERNELEGQITDCQSTLSELKDEVATQTELERRLENIETEITERSERIEDLKNRTESLKTEIQQLEEDAAQTEGLRDSDLLEKYERLSELEYERGQVETDLESLEDEIAEISELQAEKSELETDYDEYRDELKELRNRIDELERSAVETFNGHMETVLELLEYENIERVWIERKTNDGSAEAESSFDLHVVRSTEEGAVYEDTVDHLSESEREVIGLVIALSGYLVHDVHETVPVMLLDSLEAIDANRIAKLVEYFSTYPPFLIVALLPEDAQSLPDHYDRIPMGETVTA